MLNFHAFANFPNPFIHNLLTLHTAKLASSTLPEKMCHDLYIYYRCECGPDIETYLHQPPCGYIGTREAETDYCCSQECCDAIIAAAEDAEYGARLAARDYCEDIRAGRGISFSYEEEELRYLRYDWRQKHSDLMQIHFKHANCAERRRGSEAWEQR